MSKISCAPIVARLIPQNDETWQALEDIRLSDKVSDNFKAYISCEPAEPAYTPPEFPLDESVHLTTDDEQSEEDVAAVSFQGSYGCIVLGFDRIGDHGPGWRLGSGTSKSTRIDVMVIQHTQKQMGVGRFHALIHFHPDSGMLMLTAVSNQHPVVYFLNNEKIYLHSRESHVLWQRSNRIRLGRLEFVLIYDNLNAEQYSEWVATRNSLLEAYGFNIPCKKLCAIPAAANFELIQDIIIHDTLGTGGFGWVKAGVHRKTGFPCAVKRVEIKQTRHQRECNEEANIGLQFTDVSGLMSTIQVFCEHGQKKSCALPEHFYFIFPLASYGDLSHQDWSTSNNFPKIASLLRGPLEGLESLHAYGYMHRDITRKNIFIQSLTPLSAVIGDFGKTVVASEDTVTTLGPIYTLAPESLGLAWFFTISPESAHGFQHVTSKRQHKDLMRSISKYASRGDNQALLADLLEKMLAFDPEERPSAAMAIRHPFLHLCEAPKETDPSLRTTSVMQRPSKKLKTDQEVSPPNSPTIEL